ncbi:ArsR/SmtB family transcription factor [Halorussus litoreus]|uniref:ArsR/SmtB family transcription factor n=1 Tax=Halorussus litoreus TaxID=1710536 RepID=UPI0018E50B1F|nr:winged helix-turn-helix domain-containing protein [Halorussus litoreus]
MSNDGGDDRGPEDGEENRDCENEDDGEHPHQACEGSDQPAADAVSLSLDETLEILANYERRRILGYLMNAPSATASADELVEHLLAQQADAGDRPGRGHVTATLHHVHLPKLADAGVVDYDPRSQEVRYWSDDRLEEWYDCICEDE